MDESARLRAKEFQRVQRQLKLKQDLQYSRDEGASSERDGAHNISLQNIEVDINKID